MSLVFQNIDPHPPLRPACVPPTFVGGGGVDTFAGRRGGWGGGQYFGRRETQDCPLTVIISLLHQCNAGFLMSSLLLTSLRSQICKSHAIKGDQGTLF
jgi:hypothetical protein